jgi:hypothetical protein
MIGKRIASKTPQMGTSENPQPGICQSANNTLSKNGIGKLDYIVSRLTRNRVEEWVASVCVMMDFIGIIAMRLD